MRRRASRVVSTAWRRLALSVRNKKARTSCPGRVPWRTGRNRSPGSRPLSPPSQAPASDPSGLSNWRLPARRRASHSGGAAPDSHRLPVCSARRRVTDCRFSLPVGWAACQPLASRPNDAARIAGGRGGGGGSEARVSASAAKYRVEGEVRPARSCPGGCKAFSGIALATRRADRGAGTLLAPFAVSGIFQVCKIRDWQSHRGNRSNADGEHVWVSMSVRAESRPRRMVLVVRPERLPRSGRNFQWREKERLHDEDLVGGD